jgi:hypothetical protein
VFGIHRKHLDVFAELIDNCVRQFVAEADADIVTVPLSGSPPGRGIFIAKSVAILSANCLFLLPFSILSCRFVDR